MAATNNTVLAALLITLASTCEVAPADSGAKQSGPQIAATETIAQPCGLSCPRSHGTLVCPEPCVIPLPPVGEPCLGQPATGEPSTVTTPPSAVTTQPGTATTQPSTTTTQPSTTTTQPSTTTTQPSTTTTQPSTATTQPSTTTTQPSTGTTQPSTAQSGSGSATTQSTASTSTQQSVPSTSELGNTTTGATGSAAAVPSIQGDSTFGGIGGAFQVGQTGVVLGAPGGFRLVGPNEQIALRPTLGRPTDFLIAFDRSTGANSSTFLAGVAIASPILGQDMINWAENGTVLPQDRVFYDYRHYDHVGEIAGFEKQSGQAVSQFYGKWLNVDRHMFGFEKMIGCCSSFELRIPLHYQIPARTVYDTSAPGPDGSLGTGGYVPPDDVQIGNVGLNFKTYLLERENFKMTCALGIQLPTQQDSVFAQQGVWSYVANGVAGTFAERASILQENETLWLCPTFGTLYTPTDRLFNQGIFQIDIPLNPSHGAIEFNVWENQLSFNGNPTIHDRQELELVYNTLLRIDEQFGYWLRDDCCKTVSRIGALLEVEINQMLGKGELLTLVNLGPALVAQAGKTEGRVGMLLPVSDFQQYDWELAVTVNRRF